ncbi:ABC transporter ATP-binding protein [Rhodoferax sp. PAMC 29310]|uniref:ABC transporter ATP-binding protein n=1 Tax=Rhodoferax sp. PAMC 29310 TaxID=2822760 RepID=UPI001B33E2BE|nr:ABC transporter ATP-binding protein [Rhodoferax sp. PAMC 29310]
MSHPLLKIDGLVKRFGGLAATDHANLSVQRGEIHALIGPNGAGKTTLIHQISGALAPDEGHIWFDGDDVTHLPMHRRALGGLVRSYQITSIFQRLSVLDNVALAVQAISDGSFSFWKPARSEKARYAQAATVVERVGLGEQIHTLAGALSHGEQRQLEVGIALATQPQLLLLDEPMAGMGPDESERMVTLLQSLRGEATILLVEHDMDAVFRLADTISVLVSGHVIASGTPEHIKESTAVKQAYLGDDAIAMPTGQETA